MATKTISMHYCSIMKLAYMLYMLVSWIPCGLSIEIKVCNAFPDIFESQSTTIACGYDKLGIHNIHRGSFHVASLVRGSCSVFQANDSEPIECTAYAGKEENVYPYLNPTYIVYDPPIDYKGFLPYGYGYDLKQDGVYRWKLDGEKKDYSHVKQKEYSHVKQKEYSHVKKKDYRHIKKKGYESFQPWTWPVKFNIYISNGFRDGRWVYVYCKFDEWNGMQKTIYPNDVEKGLYGNSEPLSFVVNISPDDKNKIPVQVDWESRNSKYGWKHFSFFAMDKRWVHHNTNLFSGRRSYTLHYVLEETGVYLWIPDTERPEGEGKKILAESWRENQDKSSYYMPSANRKKTNKLVNLRGWKSALKKTKYYTKTWNREDYEYCSAYNLKTLYCPLESKLCPKQ